jgi:hypothetical protein
MVIEGIGMQILFVQHFAPVRFQNRRDPAKYVTSVPGGRVFRPTDREPSQTLRRGRANRSAKPVLGSAKSSSSFDLSGCSGASPTG